MRRAASMLAGLVLLVATSGCSGLQFVDDRGLVITSPPDDAQVRLPLEIEWQRKAGVPAPATYAVYVDRVPPRSGTKDDEPASERTGVYLTTATSLTITDLPPRLGARERDRNKHEITVVMLDEDGRRMGERADFVTVEVRS